MFVQWKANSLWESRGALGLQKLLCNTGQLYLRPVQTENQRISLESLWYQGTHSHGLFFGGVCFYIFSQIFKDISFFLVLVLFFKHYCSPVEVLFGVSSHSARLEDLQCSVHVCISVVVLHYASFFSLTVCGLCLLSLLLSSEVECFGTL